MSKWGKYGCPLRFHRGTYKNGLKIRRLDLELEVFAGLQREVLTDDMIRFAVGECESQLRLKIRNMKDGLEDKRPRREVLCAEIENLLDAVAQGHASSLSSRT